MGNPVPHRKPLSTLVGLAPHASDSQVRLSVPPAPRSKMPTMVGGVQPSADPDDPFDIEVDFDDLEVAPARVSKPADDLEPLAFDEPANDVEPIADEISNDDILPPRSATRPVARASRPTPTSIPVPAAAPRQTTLLSQDEVERSATRERRTRAQAVALAVITATGAGVILWAVAQAFMG